MPASLRAEFKKLLSVRSTYFLTALVWVIVAFVSFYAVGYHSGTKDLHDPNLIQNSIFGMIQLVGLISSIVGVLLLAHEYRYSTINYSLTISNSRSKVLGSKFVVLSVYAIVLCLISVGMALGLIHAGVGAHGNALIAQNYHLGDILWRTLYSVWGNTIAALILTAIIRNLVGSIVALFVIPTLEQLAELLLKNNAGYLPFTSLNAVTGMDTHQGFSVEKSAVIFAVYLVVFAFISWQLFLRRDAA